MFWVILLAHFTADYPLQTDRMVIAKQRLPGLAIHIAIQWVVMTLFTWPVRAIVWPYILAATIFHFIIDYSKVIVGRRRPQWVIGPYLIDQPLHWISLIVVCYWMAQTTDLNVWQVPSPWWIYGIGALLATHIWYVTERVMTYRDPDLQQMVIKSMWPRMAARLTLFTLIVMAKPAAVILLLILIGLLFIQYRRLNYLPIYFYLDAAAALFSALIVFAILTFF